MKTPLILTMFLCLAAVAANAASNPQVLSCHLSYVTHTEGGDPQEYTYPVASQVSLLDKENGTGFLTGKTDIASFVVTYKENQLEMHIKETDTGHEAMSVGPVTQGDLSNVYLVTDRRYNLGEDMTQIELSCTVKPL